MTNYERIKNMSIEELAEFLYNEVGEDFSGLKYFGCEDIFSEKSAIKWLESEVTEK